ncbi:MAG: MBL fold metallo-hydrolase [Sedimentisphaerales bacterium]|nr:MBL fold metallo-hydrolase [Sedimentisphaerales bacterium]
MKVECVTLGSFATNCYLLAPEKGRQVVIIDAGLDPDGLADQIKARQLTPGALILTHGHIDHIGGVWGLRRLFPQVPVYIHSLDAPMLEDPDSNLAYLAGLDGLDVSADQLVRDGQEIVFDQIQLRVIHTPGHTPGSISLYCAEQGLVFTGDALFAGSIGRTDLPGGNYQQLIRSIKTRLLTLPRRTLVYPGHGPTTTIAREIDDNPFLVEGAA